jgi:hypothetical protein
MASNLFPLEFSEQMAATTIKFFETVRNTLDIAISDAKKKEKHIGIARSIPLLQILIENLFRNFFSEEFHSDLRNAYSNMDADDTYIAGLLAQEMIYYNTLYERHENTSEPHTFDPKDGLDDAKTIKESFEKLIKRLPSRAKKVLSILNEILGLAKSII